MQTEEITLPTAEVRDRIKSELAVLAVIDDAVAQVGLTGLTSFNYGKFEYPEPMELAEESDEARRTAALSWLAKHAKIITLVGRNLKLKVEKYEDYGEFGLRALGEAPDGRWFMFRAAVPSALTCEMVDTGETETVPAVAEHERPIYEKRCPESIFAGVQDEIEVPE